jgi:hypothetical protein
MSMKAMKAELVGLGGSADGCLERPDVVSRLLEARRLAENAMDEDEKMRKRRDPAAPPPQTSRRAFSNYLERLGGLHQLRLRKVWVWVWVCGCEQPESPLICCMCVCTRVLYMCPHTTLCVLILLCMW